MAIEIVFESGAQPKEYLLWKTIAEAILGNKQACVVARHAVGGWDVSVFEAGCEGASTVLHPHLDGDFERELRDALRAAGIAVAP
jgi:hypothetical protein